MYTGIVIAESLTDPSIINRLQIVGGEVCKDPNNPGDYWHLYTVQITEQQAQEIGNMLKPHGFYAHFGNSELGLVVFPNRVFKMNPRDSASWVEAITYGRAIGIPEQQLDFNFDEFLT